MRGLITLAGIVLLVIVGFWIFDDGNDDLATDLNNNGNATTTEDLTGTGGPDEGFDPLEDFDPDNGLYENFSEEGKG